MHPRFSPDPPEIVRSWWLPVVPTSEGGHVGMSVRRLGLTVAAIVGAGVMPASPVSATESGLADLRAAATSSDSAAPIGALSYQALPSGGEKVIASITVDQLRQARAEGRRQDGLSSAQRATEYDRRDAARADFVADSRNRGLNVQSADVDVLGLGKLGGRDVLLALPKSDDVMAVNFIGVPEGNDGYSVRVAVDVEPESLGGSPVVKAGDGVSTTSGNIECPIESISGSWKITILDVGYFYTNWQKCKAGSNSSYDTWVYKRWGVGKALATHAK